MKRILIVALAISVLAFTVSAAPKEKCTTIQSGEILYSASHYLAGQPLMTGFDSYGYNYQGHYFVGSYFNVYAGGAGFPPYMGDDDAYLGTNPTAANHWAWPYRHIRLLMKWNDAWISNKDCDGDGALDRHYGFGSYIGSGAWETNHMFGEGDPNQWTYFTKIVAKPSADFECNEIWGAFCTTMDVNSGSGSDIYDTPGFGLW